MDVTQDWIDICRTEMEALGAASQRLIIERSRDGWDTWTQEMMDRRRAELYAEELGKVGLTIVRVTPEQPEDFWLAMIEGRVSHSCDEYLLADGDCEVCWLASK